MALAHGSTGGVYLTGSLTKSLLFDLDFNNFRSIFEDSVSMNNLYPVNLRNISLRIIAQDFSSIFTEGFSEVSLLIREP